MPSLHQTIPPVVAAGWLLLQVLYIAHAGDSGAVMACTSFSLSFPLRLTADHKPNRCSPRSLAVPANSPCSACWAVHVEPS